MKFEDEFPSLKGDGTKGKAPLEMTTAEYIGRLVTEIPFKLKEGYGPIINLRKEEDIQKHCIDKQRVRKAIKFIANNEHPEFNSGWQTKLLKELGLEE